jgi:hypothetical protein
MQVLCDFRIKEIRDEERVKQTESKVNEVKVKELESLCSRQASALRFFNLQMFVSTLISIMLNSLSNGRSIQEYRDKARRTIT